MGKNSQCQKTIKAATQCRLNQELKFLYIKKQKLNERLYIIHLEQNKTSFILNLLGSCHQTCKKYNNVECAVENS